MSKKLTEKQLEKFWDEAELLAQEKIYDLLTCNLPIPGLKLITHAYNFSEKHQNLTGLFLGKDVDYRTLELELRDKYVEEKLPSKEHLAEEIAF